MSIEATIVVTAIALWFAQGWYLNTRLNAIHEKLDRVLGELNGLRDYLYEIDPQFDDERALNAELFESTEGNGPALAGMSLKKLEKQKQAGGKRTLDTPFFRANRGTLGDEL